MPGVHKKVIHTYQRRTVWNGSMFLSNIILGLLSWKIINLYYKKCILWCIFRILIYSSVYLVGSVNNSMECPHNLLQYKGFNELLTKLNNLISEEGVTKELQADFAEVWVYVVFVISYPAGIYLLKVDNRNTRTTCEIWSKLTIKTPEKRQWRWISSFDKYKNSV